MTEQSKDRVSKTFALKHTQSVTEKVPYSEKDLAYVGLYAKELSKHLKNPIWDTFTRKQNDSDLGIYLAEQYKAFIREVGISDISDNLSNMLNNSFEPFMEKFMDALDTKINQNIERVTECP